MLDSREHNNQITQVIWMVLVLLIGGCQGSEPNSPNKDSTDSSSIPSLDEDVLLTRLSPHMLPAPLDTANRNQLIDFILEKQWDMNFHPEGFFYHLFDEGSASHPTWGDRVSVHYHGYLLNGQKFDSSIDRSKPFTFYVGNVVAGWNKALPLLGVGGRGVFLFPATLAYGKQGFKHLVPPDAPLLFEMNLLEILADEDNLN